MELRKMLKTSWWLIILLICASFVNTFPSRPLNERSTELNWQAWLLIDPNNRQTDLGILRRRITPKSVFIAPTFSPDTLPACADGYRSDSMGRCVKIIRIDEAAHLNFLLQRLNEQFGDYDEDAEDSSSTATKGNSVNSGPYQFNIPLFGDSDQNYDSEEDNDTNVAIVVAPTTSASVKLDVKRTNNDKFNVDNVAKILGVKPEDLEHTTISSVVTNQPTTSITETTTDFSTYSTEEMTETMSTSQEFDQESTTTIMSTTVTESPTSTEEEQESTITATTTTRTTRVTTPAATAVTGDALYFRWRI